MLKEDEVMDLLKLDKRTKSLKKKIRRLDDSLDPLEQRVSDLERRQSTLMHNLRRVMRHFNMNVEQPNDKDKGKR